MTGEEIIFFMWGDGANGKSTFRETLFELMGDYAAVGNKDLLIASKRDVGRATPELAKLHGKRLVTINETRQGDVLNEDRLKAITSHDKIPARFLYENEFDFYPTHKGFITTQHKSIIKGIDEGLWRRIHLWLFGYTFPEDERDKYFRENVLLPELPGILNWALAGLRDYQQRGGLEPPDTVVAATDEYRNDLDLVGRWIAEKCEKDQTKAYKTSDMYAAFKIWLEAEMGFVSMSADGFGRHLAHKRHGLTRVSVDRNRGFRGLRVPDLEITVRGTSARSKRT